MNKEFTSVAKFHYKNNYYEMFKTLDEKIAFLKIVDNKYDYPTEEEFNH